MQKPEVNLKCYDFFVALFVATLIISNVLAQKLFSFGPTVFTAGIIVFPVAYILGDVLTEVYGYARTRRIIWFGFLANLMFVLLTSAAIALPPASIWPFQKEFEQVLGQVPRIVAASLVAYLAGEFANSFVLAKLKLATNGKHLWTRIIGSTVVGQGVDTVIFVAIAFGGLLPLSSILPIAFWGYLFKVAYEALATPITYAVVRAVKRIEGIDVFDRKTDFNPFSLDVKIEDGNEDNSTSR